MLKSGDIDAHLAEHDSVESRLKQTTSDGWHGSTRSTARAKAPVNAGIVGDDFFNSILCFHQIMDYYHHKYMSAQPHPTYCKPHVSLSYTALSIISER